MSGRYDWNRGSARPVEMGVEEPRHDDYEEPKKLSITGGRLLKWGVLALGLFGAGYALRGWAESANGTANLLGALRGGRKREDGDLSGLGVIGAGGGSIPGMWPGLGRPPTPEELAYWGTFYKRGAAAIGELPPAVLPQLPAVEREPLPPVTRTEQMAERSLLAPSRPRTPRYGWQGGYSGMGGGYSYDGFGGGSGGYADSGPSLGGGEEPFTIVKE